jgi:hypothetical protein
MITHFLLLKNEYLLIQNNLDRFPVQLKYKQPVSGIKKPYPAPGTASVDTTEFVSPSMIETVSIQTQQ